MNIHRGVTGNNQDESFGTIAAAGIQELYERFLGEFEAVSKGKIVSQKR